MHQCHGTVEALVVLSPESERRRVRPSGFHAPLNVVGVPGVRERIDMRRLNGDWPQIGIGKIPMVRGHALAALTRSCAIIR